MCADRDVYCLDDLITRKEDRDSMDMDGLVA
jgi:hypothetical protein